MFGTYNFTDVDADVVSDTDVYDDVNSSGGRWKDTALKMKEDHPDVKHCSILWPLILFIDGVSHGEFTNLNQEPAGANDIFGIQYGCEKQSTGVDTSGICWL